MELATAINRFESFLRVEKNLSPRTRKAYRYDLERLGVHLAAGRETAPRVEAIGETDLREFLDTLSRENKIAAATRSRLISSLRAFFRFLTDENHLEVSPAENLELPKKPRKLPIFMVESELRALLNAPPLDEPRGLRDRAMMIMMSFCGLRLQELVGLDVADVDFTTETVRVFGKGSRERLVPLNPDVITALIAWLQERSPADGEKALFLNRFGRRLTGRMVEKIVDKYLLQTGLSQRGFSPHKLRHSFATLLHGHDVDLVEIQSLLGHASITTTQIYTHTNVGRLRDAVERIDLKG